MQRLTHAYTATMRLLPLLYFVWAVLVGSVLAFVMPPWQNADEATHVLRAVEIAHGELLAWRLSPRRAGGRSDIAVVQSEAAMYLPYQNPELRVRAPMLRDAAAVRWGRVSVLGFDNTATYPPFLYVVAAAAAAIGRLSHMHVVATLQLMRVANGIAAAAIGAAALAWAERTRLALAAVLLLPMTIALAASPAQDSLLIPLAACAVAAADRACQMPAGQPLLRLELGAAAAVLLVALARPPYLSLACVLLAFPGRRGLRRRLAWVAVIVVGACAWSAYVAWRIGVPMNVAMPSQQLAFLLGRPLAFPAALLRTCTLWWWGWLTELVGDLGWLTVPLPGSAVRWGLRVLLLATAAAALPDRSAAAPAWWRCRFPLGLLACLAGAIGIALAMYVIWTAPGASLVEGIQGRYFLPLLPMLALGMPSLGRWARILQVPALVGVLLLAVVGPVVTISALVERYYMQP